MILLFDDFVNQFFNSRSNYQYSRYSHYIGQSPGFKPHSHKFISKTHIDRNKEKRYNESGYHRHDHRKCNLLFHNSDYKSCFNKLV